MNNGLYPCVVVLVFCSVAWPQLEHGSVAVFYLRNDAIIVAADSRASSVQGTHNDSECKIRNFGGQFVFAATGINGPTKRPGSAWSVYDEGRAAWQDAARFASMSSAKSLTHQTAEKWATAIQEHLHDVDEISILRKTLDHGNTICSGIFGATNDAGDLAVSRAYIRLDLAAFDSNKIINLTHTIEDSVPPTAGAIGLGAVANEYATKATPRAKKFMNSYEKKLANRSPEERDIATVEKLVELSIDLDPLKRFLGAPIDELVLEKGKNVRWVHVKQNCPK